MSQLVSVTGMILSVSPIGEYDKRVVILTKERGKISAFARGARRPKSALSGVTAPCMFGEFSLFEGRTSYNIQHADIQNYFSEIRMDVDAACYAFYFLEMADYFTREANDEREMLKLLYQTMRILTKQTISFRLIRSIFEWKAVWINGVGPQVFRCVSCGKNEENGMFSVRKGGMLCAKCRGAVIDVQELNPSTWYALQFISATPIEKLYTFTVKEDVLKELEQLGERYLEVYVGKHFQSLDILNQMQRLEQ